MDFEDVRLQFDEVVKDIHAGEMTQEEQFLNSQLPTTHVSYDGNRVLEMNGIEEQRASLMSASKLDTIQEVSLVVTVPFELGARRQTG